MSQSSLDLISTERDLLTKYTESFSQKQGDVTAKYRDAIDRLAASIQSENEETAALAQLQKQMDELSLNVTLNEFKDMQADLAAKFKTYTDLVASNNTLAASIFEGIQSTKDLVGEILTVVADLDTNIAQINTTIDTYNAASASASATPTPAPSAEVPATPTEAPEAPVADA